MNRTTRKSSAASGRRALATLAALAAAALAAGCASTKLAFPATTIVGDPTGRRSDVYDAYDLFDRADKAFVAADWPNAIRNYEKVLKEYADSDVAPLARYNLGLAFENTGAWAQALATYDGFSTPPPTGVKTEEVRMRRGIRLQNLKRRREAAREFRKILQQLLGAAAAVQRGAPAPRHCLVL